MTNISYLYIHGTLVGIWPGKSVYVSGRNRRKEGQIYLGKVINADKNLFWSRKRGYFIFDPASQTFLEPDPELIPVASLEPDKRRGREHCIVDFGDAFFLHQLIHGIGYNKVIDAIEFQNKDSLYAAIEYYMLENSADCYADLWCRQNIASFIYPKANLAGQRFSNLLSKIGTPENKRKFIEAHIAFLLDLYLDLCIIIDSTGLPNSCKLPVTCISNHEGNVSLEFRLIAVIQKSTGLPLFYEIIEGNIVDISTLERVIYTLAEYKCKVIYCLSDAGYLCPSVMERLILSGIDFISRLNPAYKIYKDAFNKHFEELNDPANSLRYRNRIIQMIEIPSIIAIDKETNKEIFGYIYLCKDIQRNLQKANAFLNSNQIQKMTTDQIHEALNKFGVFAIISAKKLEKQEVLPEFYIRQDIEQYFDFGKNYCKYVPVRQHNMKTLSGHILLSFIATFLTILIKNRLNILDANFVCIPAKYSNKSSKCISTIIEQDPLLDIFKSSTITIFKELRAQKADVYEKSIIPTIANKKINDIYTAFGLASPSIIYRNGLNLKFEYKVKPSGCTKELAFTRKPCISEEEIRSNLKSASQIEDENTIEKRGRGRPKGSLNKATLIKLQQANPQTQQSSSEAEQQNQADSAEEKRGRGRPKGSLNKATLIKLQQANPQTQQSSSEAEQQNQADSAEEKRGRGRPKGSLNKATLIKLQQANPQTQQSSSEAEQQNQADSAEEKRGRGRPKGSLNKATLIKLQQANPQTQPSSSEAEQ